MCDVFCGKVWVVEGECITRVERDKERKGAYPVKFRLLDETRVDPEQASDSEAKRPARDARRPRLRPLIAINRGVSMSLCSEDQNTKTSFCGV